MTVQCNYRTRPIVYAVMLVIFLANCVGVGYIMVAQRREDGCTQSWLYPFVEHTRCSIGISPGGEPAGVGFKDERAGAASR